MTIDAPVRPGGVLHPDLDRPRHGLVSATR
jgi:hypothetical protein